MKGLDMFNIMINLKNIFYEDKEIHDTMLEFYLIQRNLIISRLVVYKKAFDISRKGSHPHPTPSSQQNHKNTNHRV